MAALQTRRDDHLSSYNHDVLAQVHVMDPEIKIGWLYSGQDWHAAIADAQRAGCDALHPMNYQMTPELVAEAHQAGLKIEMWDTDSERRAKQLIDWGIDGIATYDPARIRKFVETL